MRSHAPNEAEQRRRRRSGCRSRGSGLGLPRRRGKMLRKRGFKLQLQTEWMLREELLKDTTIVYAGFTRNHLFFVIVELMQAHDF